MNLFKNLFRKKEPEFKPDNTHLLTLLQQYNSNPTQELYAEVMNELYGETAYLVIPTAGKVINSTEWTTLEAGETLDFTSVFDVDGVLVFGVFTSDIALSKWITQETSFISMPAKKVLEIAQEQQFGRIVIDSDQETMFVLERNTNTTTEIKIEEDTQVLVWYPAQPISGQDKAQLCQAFAKISVIEEVYHFGMTRNQEQILILAFLLHEVNEPNRKAVIQAMNEGMTGIKLKMPLELLYIARGDAWEETGKQFEVFYRKD